MALTRNVLLSGLLAASLAGTTVKAAPAAVWLDPAATPDARAQALNRELTIEEKLTLVHGHMAMRFPGLKAPDGAIGSAGYVAGVPRLGVPALQETDAGLGVSNLLNMRPGDVATPLPSAPMMAATFDPALAREAGAMIGHEAWSKGFNLLLGGGANLIRDPRSGRYFEYYSEDPLLAGVMAGETISGTQSQHVISTAKHFAFANQETGRYIANPVIDEAAARESDLLAFEIALEHGRPGAVMCAYNRFQNRPACENSFLLTSVLKDDWAFPGWVMSDWGAVHSLDAAAAGLDQESAQERDKLAFFDQPLKAAVASDAAWQKRLSDMSGRILRSMFAVGLFDHPPTPTPIDYAADAAVARKIAAEGLVLLANKNGLLPLSAATRSIVVIGGHADAGVLSGGGSSQVIPFGGPARSVPVGGEGYLALIANMIFDPSSPLAAIAAKAKGASIHFVDGRYPSEAAAAARRADVAIVFANQWMFDGHDAPDLSLPSGQDELIQAVTRANPRTVVVLETGGPVAMPWLAGAAAVLEAWYPGAKGGDAIADVLFGDVSPSGRLPVSFPRGVEQLPRPTITGSGGVDRPFDVALNEGADVGYRWYAKKGESPLFAFGYGLSYTTFSYGHVAVSVGATTSISFDVTNTGVRSGTDVPQVYLVSACGRPTRRLVGWTRIALAPGEARRVTVEIDPRLLADYRAPLHHWLVEDGTYGFAVGSSAEDLKIDASAQLASMTLKP